MHPRGLIVLIAALSLFSSGAIAPAGAQGQRSEGYPEGRPNGREGVPGGYGRPQAWAPQGDRGARQANRGGYPGGGYPARAYPSPAYPSPAYPPQPFSTRAYPSQPSPERVYPRSAFAEPAVRFRDGGPAPTSGRADWRNEQDEARQAVREGRHIPLGQAIDAVRRRSAGRELDANLEAGPNGRSVYRVRWATTDGRRIDYLVDAATGAIVDAQGGR